MQKTTLCNICIATYRFLRHGGRSVCTLHASRATRTQAQRCQHRDGGARRGLDTLWGSHFGAVAAEAVGDQLLLDLGSQYLRHSYTAEQSN
jgi:hypothetical protein